MSCRFLAHLRGLFGSKDVHPLAPREVGPGADGVATRKLTGRVRWLKAVEGGVDIPMLGAGAHAASSLARMGDAIAGTEDAVATYVKLGPRAKYNEGRWRPGAIAGILWLAPMAAGKTVFDHAEDEEYAIGWPVAARDLTPGPMLRELVQNLYGPDFDGVWAKLRGSMTGGRPFRIDEGTYARIGEALTAFYSAPKS